MQQPEPLIPLAVPPDWQDAGSAILGGDGVRRVLVLGAPDAGKSSFCRLVLQQASRRGRPASLLDVDLGQKQLGPPACVTLGLADAAGGVPGLCALSFQGSLEPLAAWPRLIPGTARLAAAAPPGLLLVNTSGLLKGAGRRLKAAKIAALRPDLLVAIGADAALEAVLADHPHIPVRRLARPAQAVRKGGNRRRRLRAEAFAAYFAPAPAWPIDLAGLRMEQAGVTPWPAPRQLVALLDGAGHDLALALVEAPDEPHRLWLRAPRVESPVAGLRWGGLWLDPGWNAHEIPRPPRA
jgi:polynucleotide 5'-hydroxyl-kinase GRC3/NOL9